MWFLAAAVDLAARTPLETWGPIGVVIVLLGGKDGIIWIIRRIGGKRGKCPLHDGLVSDIADMKKDLRMLVEHLLGKD